MPFNLGFGEVLIILVVILLLFGAKRIPEIAGSLGKGINSFKKSINEVEGSIRNTEPEFRRELDHREPVGGRETLVRKDEAADAPEPKRLLN